MTQAAFVTGSTGFLGRHLCQQLLASGWQVTAMCRSIPENALQGVKYVTADLQNKDSMMAVFPTGIQAVFHTAADTSTWRKERARQTATNVDGTQHLLEVAIAQQANTFVYVSSITTFGVDHHGMIELNEQTPQEGSSSWVNYVRTKSLAEQAVKASSDQIKAVVVNPTHIIGPDDQHNWIRLFKMMIQDKLPTIPVGAGSFVDVRDVARGCMLAAERGHNGSNYILGGHNLHFEQFIDQTAEAFDLQLTKRRKPLWLVRLVAKIQLALSYLTNQQPDLTPESLQIISHQFEANTQQAETQLGYAITPLAQTLGDIKTNLQQRGIL